MQLYPFQEAAVEAALTSPRPIRRLFALDTGLGKSASAITTAKKAGAKRILIACPAMVRSAWLEQLDTWWPEHPTAAVITMGKTRTKGVSKKEQEQRDRAYQAQIQVVSYDLLDQVDPSPWDFVFLDEIHRCKNAGSQVSHAARAICLANPRAGILGLSASPIPDQVTDLWGQLDLLWPGRFGKPDKNGKHSWQFRDRYSNKRHNGYGWDFTGVNELHLPELKRRLEAVSTRVSKAEVAHLLPAFQVQLLKVKPHSPEFWKQQKTTSAEELENVLITAGLEKTPHVTEWVEDALSNSTSHVAILTHLKDTAKEIALQLQKKFGADIEVYCITGDQSPEHRNRELGFARSSRKAIVVATMHSIGIGIDLTWCPQALFAELYWRPETMLQAVGRFSRLSGKVPSSVFLMVLEGTQDELVASSLLDKFSSINKTIAAGSAEAKLEEALATPESDESFLASLLQLSAETVDESSQLL